MEPTKVLCNAGCQEIFILDGRTQTVQLDGGIEKTFFTCSHCQHEYVSFYTDAEIRELQEKIRKVQQKFVNPNYDHDVVVKQESKLKLLIKEKMDVLKVRFNKI
jgi:hypothetical protein